MIDLVLTEIHREFKKTGFESLDIGKVEFAAQLEMLAVYAFTGEIKVCPTKLWKHLGISHNINYHGFPFIDPSKLSLETGLARVQGWPQAEGKDSLPELTYIHALKFHYGAGVAKAHHYWALFTQFTLATIRTIDDVYSAIDRILEFLMIPETSEWVRTNLGKASRKLRNQNLKGANSEEEAVVRREFHECEEQLSDFESANRPFLRGK